MRARKRRGDKSGTGPGEAFEKWQAEPGETQLMRKDNEETDMGKSEREFERNVWQEMAPPLARRPAKREADRPGE